MKKDKVAEEKESYGLRLFIVARILRKNYVNKVRKENGKHIIRHCGIR